MTASDVTDKLVRFILDSVQLAPLLVERNTPSPAPAKILVPETARALMFRFVKPLLTAVQLVPSSVERKTPPSRVPAKRLVLETAKHWMNPP
jgi:hypothetical protein